MRAELRWAITNWISLVIVAFVPIGVVASVAITYLRSMPIAPGPDAQHVGGSGSDSRVSISGVPSTDDTALRDEITNARWARQPRAELWVTA